MAESTERMIARLMTLGTVGTEMVAPILVGWFVDFQLGTMPLVMILGALLGLIGGIYHLIVLNRVNTP